MKVLTNEYVRVILSKIKRSNFNLISKKNVIVYVTSPRYNDFDIEIYNTTITCTFVNEILV